MQKMIERFLKDFLNKCLFIVCIGCWVFASSAVASGAGSSTIDKLLDNLEKRYSKKEFAADFTQTSKLNVLELDETASGKALFSHPGKMVWEYLKPQQHKIITDGKMLWIVRPELNQVMIGETGEYFKEGAGGAFLSDISIVREKYLISIKENSETFFLLLLIPKKKTPEIQSILIMVLKKNYNIKKIITSNIYDDTTEFEFSNIEFKDIDDSAFKFNVPEKFSVIQIGG